MKTRFTLVTLLLYMVGGIAALAEEAEPAVVRTSTHLRLARRNDSYLEMSTLAGAIGRESRVRTEVVKDSQGRERIIGKSIVLAMLDS